MAAWTLAGIVRDGERWLALIATPGNALGVKRLAAGEALPDGRRIVAIDAIRMQASVFVAQNSEGGKYAKKIHDERYVTWRRLGPGSIAANKSGKIGEKFIERAIVDNEKMIQDALRKKLERIGL